MILKINKCGRNNKMRNTKNREMFEKDVRVYQMIVGETIKLRGTSPYCIETVAAHASFTYPPMTPKYVHKYFVEYFNIAVAT